MKWRIFGQGTAGARKLACTYRGGGAFPAPPPGLPLAWYNAVKQAHRLELYNLLLLHALISMLNYSVTEVDVAVRIPLVYSTFLPRYVPVQTPTSSLEIDQPFCSIQNLKPDCAYLREPFVYVSRWFLPHWCYWNKWDITTRKLSSWRYTNPGSGRFGARRGRGQAYFLVTSTS